MKRARSKPVLRHIANLWTLMGHPTKQKEWSLDKKLAAIKVAGFDGVCWAGSPELRDGCRQHGLVFVGGIASGNAKDFPRSLREQKDCGAVHVNVQLGSDDLLMPDALKLALVLHREVKRIGVVPGIETHRGTATETPEKTYALCDAYQKRTGELLPLSIDFSHFTVVKQSRAGKFCETSACSPGADPARAAISFSPAQRPSRASAHHGRKRKSDA